MKKYKSSIVCRCRLTIHDLFVVLSLAMSFHYCRQDADIVQCPSAGDAHFCCWPFAAVTALNVDDCWMIINTNMFLSDASSDVDALDVLSNQREMCWLQLESVLCSSVFNCANHDRHGAIKDGIDFLVLDAAIHPCHLLVLIKFHQLTRGKILSLISFTHSSQLLGAEYLYLL